MVIAVGLAWWLVMLLTSQEQGLRASGNELTDIRSFWREQIKASDGASAAEDFYATALSKATPSIDAHTLAHLFGEALYEEVGLAGIGYCRTDFEFGCFHSFFALAVKEKGIEILPILDDACVEAFGTAYLPCQHGLGHGIVVYTGYDALLEALTLCEKIRWQPLGGCSSGVFMEHNFHTMAASETGTSFLRPLEDDVYAPCSTLPQKHQPSCYQEQVQWWQNHFSNDFTYIGTLCDAVPETENRTACFNGIGNYVAASNNLNVTSITTICGTMPNQFGIVECQQGGAWLVRGDGSGIESAEKVCEGLQNEEAIATCRERLY